MSAVVPIDRMRIARITAVMSIYLVVYLYWLRTEGLPIDRISVAISLFLFLVCRLFRQAVAHLGSTPSSTWPATRRHAWIAYETPVAARRRTSPAS